MHCQLVGQVFELVAAPAQHKICKCELKLEFIIESPKLFSFSYLVYQFKYFMVAIKSRSKLFLSVSLEKGGKSLLDVLGGGED